MKQEIERKFLVTGDGWRGKAEGVLIRQGYIARTRDRVVRVRLAGNKGFLTIKVRQGSLLTRDEFEYPIPADEAQALLASLSPGEIIEKRRHTFLEQGMVWEVDEFLGANQGLIVAEVELEREDQPFARPAWLGQEVSRVSRYLNVELAEHPYATWRHGQSGQTGQNAPGSPDTPDEKNGPDKPARPIVPELAPESATLKS